MNTTHYTLISNGKVLDGFNEDDVLINVAKALAANTEDVQKELMSGKARKIKRSDFLAKLQKLEMKLLDLGLDVVIEKKTTHEDSEYDSDDLEGERKSNIFWMIIVLAGLLICAAALWFLFIKL